MPLRPSTTWSGQLIAELVLRESTLGELVEHHHAIDVRTVELRRRRQLLVLPVAEVALTSVAAASSLRVECVLILDAKLFGHVGRLIRHLGSRLLLQSGSTQLTGWTLLPEGALGPVRFLAALRNEPCSRDSQSWSCKHVALHRLLN